MPYKNIHFVKLEKRLLNDYRFYTMSEDSQLIYVKFLMLAAETRNKIPKKVEVIKEALRSRLKPDLIQKCIDEIKDHYPKFKENPHYYYFGEFKNRLNWVLNSKLVGTPKELPRSAKGVRKDKIEEDKDKDKEQDIDKEEDKEKGTPPPFKNFKKKPYFKGLEMRKAQGKWWVIPKGGGKWLEFAGKELDITYK
jgi:hypothetical protein